MPAMTVKIRLETIQKDVVCFNYECSMAMGMIINGVIGLLKSKMPDGIEVNSDAKKISVFPKQIDDIKKVMEYLRLDDIQFREDGLMAVISLI